MKPTTILLAFVATLGICVSAAPNTSPSFELDYSDCNDYSPPPSLQIFDASGTTSIGPDGQNFLLATLNFATYDMITSGSYNITATGNDGPGTTPTSWSDGGTLDSIFTPLPLAAGNKGVASLELLLFEGQNNFNMTATDQYGEQITCFTFSYQLKGSIEKKRSRTVAATASSLRHPVTNTQSSRRRRTASLTRAHL